MELTMTHHQHAGEAIGSHRRRPRPAVQQGDLAEEVAGMELGNRVAAVEHGEMAVKDDEELVANLALLGQDLVETDHDLVAELPEPLELAGGHAGEQRHLAQMVELLVVCHCAQSTVAGQRLEGSRSRANRGTPTDSVVGCTQSRVPTGTEIIARHHERSLSRSNGEMAR